MTTKVTVEVPAGANYKARVAQTTHSPPLSFVLPGESKEYIVTSTGPISNIAEVAL